MEGVVGASEDPDVLQGSWRPSDVDVAEQNRFRLSRSWGQVLPYLLQMGLTLVFAALVFVGAASIAMSFDVIVGGLLHRALRVLVFCAMFVVGVHAMAELVPLIQMPWRGAGQREPAYRVTAAHDAITLSWTGNTLHMSWTNLQLYPLRHGVGVTCGDRQTDEMFFYAPWSAFPCDRAEARRRLERLQAAGQSAP